MKILFIIYRFYPSIGGSQNHVLSLAEEFTKKGHHVTVATTNSLNNIDIRGFSTGRKFTLKSKKKQLAKQELYKGIKIIRFTPWFQIWTYLLYPSLFFYLLKNIKKFDIIHAHCYQTSEPDTVNLVSILRKKRFIFTAHDIITPFKGIGGFIKKVYDLTFGKLLLHKAKFLIALTEENKKQYLTLGNYQSKIKLIPNGINFNRINSLKINNTKLAKYQILFVGRLIEYKGAQYIIESISNILKFTTDIKFIFIGEDQGYKKTLLDLAKKLGVIKYCFFTGKVNNNELYNYYRNSNIFILPSTGEGFGLVALEAIMSGAYPILAKSGGLIHVLQKIGGEPIIMQNNIPQQISNQVINILNNLNSRKSEIFKMQEIIKNNYTWAKIAEQTEKVYLESLK